MTIKSLLLGSAAAVAVVGGAQAADLSVAEPVEYVKVCDYFGAGYWYIPGTDTCIKISGYVEENAYFHENSYTGGSRSSTWNFSNVVQLDVDTKSQTEYGVLEGLVSFGGGQGGSYGLGDDGAFVSLGGFKAGAYQLAAYQQGGIYAFTDNHGPVNNEIYGTFGYNLLQTVQLSWAAGGINASIAVSDPTSSSFLKYGALAGNSSPLITGNIGWSAGKGSFYVSGGFLPLTAGYGSAWGIDANAHFSLSPVDAIILNASYGSMLFTQNGFDAGLPGFIQDDNNSYSLLAGWQHNLSKTLALQLVGSYGSWGFTTPGGSSGYALNADLVWSPVTNFSVTGAVVYSKNSYAGSTSPYNNDFSGAWTASLSVKRSW